MIGLFGVLLLAGTVVLVVQLFDRLKRLERRLDRVEHALVAARRAESLAPEAVEPVAAMPEPAEPEAPMPEAEPLAWRPPVPPEPVTVDAPAPARRFGFEDVFGRYLPIWAGGITLIVAGVLIVKYSIDAGLLSPTVRVLAGLLFGTMLLGAAEAALRNAVRVPDRRIPQSLAGAGIATLYAALLIAANLYHLIDPMTAFVGLALVTVLAGGLSLRFGAPSAILGLVGGLAAPALVGAAQPNIPLLASYLALTVGGLCALGRSQRWWWLGGLAILGGFGWGLALIFTGVESLATTLSLGTLTLLLAIAFPLLLTGGRRVRVVAAFAGCAQMAAIVATGGFGGLQWALFGLIAAAIVWLSWRKAAPSELPLASLTVGVLLVLAWPTPDPMLLALVVAGGALIHGLPAQWRLWRPEGKVGAAAQIALVATGIALLPLLRLVHDNAADFTPLALLGAAIAGASAALGWTHAARRDDDRFAILSLTAIALALLAAGLAFQLWTVAPMAALAALAALALGRKAEDRRVEAGGGVFAVVSLLFLLGTWGAVELMRASGEAVPGDALKGLVRWIVPAAVALCFARWSSDATARRIGAADAVALGYVALAQVVPAPLLALIPAAMLVGLAWLRGATREAPLTVAGLIALGWAALPLSGWLVAGGWALGGQPFPVTAVPSIADILIRVVAPTAALGLLVHRGDLPARMVRPLAIAVAALGVVGLHMLWKHAFAIDGQADFIARGMAERTLWEMLLLALAIGAWRLDLRRVAVGLGGASLLHFAWFTGLVHNPLWAVQSVGLWLVPAYATAWTLVGLSARVVETPIVARIRDGARMVLILAFAATALRQLFHGSMPALGAVTEAEDIAYSLAAILLALGFLYWGIAREAKDWRIASLVLMLGAVGKVFLFDAAGLGGLLRIGSFIALGVSLIGVGWLYSRFLPGGRQLPGLTDRKDSVDIATGEGK